MELSIFQKGFNYSQDGPGNRLVYHLQGCNMRCPWCSNPEGLEVKGIPGICKRVPVEAVLEEAVRSRLLFFDGGGVTLTGGEITMQFDAVKALLKGLKSQGIHTAVETNGTHPRMQELLDEIDYLIMDCKHYDAHQYRELAANGSAVIQNLRLALNHGGQVLVRIPLIGSFNAREGDIQGFIQLFKTFQWENAAVELLRYHEYGRDKWLKHWGHYAMTPQAQVSQDDVQLFEQALQAHHIPVKHT